MPHELILDLERRLVLMRLWGAMTPGEMRTMVIEVREHPQLTPEFVQLVDLRELTSVEAIDGSDIRAVAASALAPSPRRAIVATDPAAFGLARMFATFRNLKDADDQIGVFRTMREAEDWLGLIPSP